MMQRPSPYWRRWQRKKGSRVRLSARVIAPYVESFANEKGNGLFVLAK